MTDQDNLRDRIESIIEDKTYATAPDGYIAGTEEAAQAIIDEFGLTVEMRVSSVDRTVDRRTGIVTNSTQYRVVGKWEKQ